MVQHTPQDDDRINLTPIGLSALDAMCASPACNPALKVCRVCWYGPECGPFYGIERTSIDIERRCPCECHAPAPVLFAGLGFVPLTDKRTNGYRGGNGDTKLRGAK